MKQVFTPVSAPSQTEPYVARFRSFLRDAVPNDPPWIRQLRKIAMSYFAETGFPTTRQEDWRFTNVSPLLELPFEPIDTLTRRSRNLDRFAFRELECHRLVFLDGHYCEELSDLPEPNGLLIGNLSRMLQVAPRQIEKHLGQYVAHDSNGFTGLNTAFFQDGAFISVPANIAIELPVHLLYVATGNKLGAAVHPRNLVLVEQNSSISVLESYVHIGDAPYLTNSVTEIVVGEDARLEHCRVQTESEQSFHIATVHAHQESGSQWRSHSIAAGARLSRNHIETTLGGEGAEALLNGLYLGRGEQVVDHHTVVNHAKPHCESHEFYHGILDGRSHGVFNGKIYVQQQAQKTNAKQTNRNLLLSEDAVVDTKPQLEIFADDVKCTHGATIGQLNDNAIFYLRARGIGLEDARRMLIHAFGREIIDRISVEPARADLDRMLMGRFEHGRTERTLSTGHP